MKTNNKRQIQICLEMIDLFANSKSKHAEGNKKRWEQKLQKLKNNN